MLWRMGRGYRIGLVAAGIGALLPSIAHADMYLPTIYAYWILLLPATLVVGLLEGSLLALTFRLPWKRALGYMIIANYISMLVGVVATLPLTAMGLIELLADATIYTAQACVTKAFWVWTAATFVGSVAIEWPLVWILFRKSGRPRRQSLAATLIAQVASYAILVPLSHSVQSTHLFSDVKPVQSLSRQEALAGSVYYLSTDGKLCAVRLDGSGCRELTEAAGRRRGGWIYLQRRKGSDAWWSIVSDSRGKTECLLPHAIPAKPSSDPEARTFTGGGAYPCDDLRIGRQEWYFEAEWQPAEGVSAWNTRTGRRLRITLDTPFLSWRSGGLTVLPGDIGVYQLGDQIVVIDPKRREIALLGRGSSPIPVPDGGPWY